MRAEGAPTRSAAPRASATGLIDMCDPGLLKTVKLASDKKNVCETCADRAAQEGATAEESEIVMRSGRSNGVKRTVVPPGHASCAI
ncbi:hypothetical protein WME98_03495 [Sorangium sp. So ce296]|uniref:hypothetical protein n=1 Tax=Sorangium sp. So ce296 TaxID=3133296 RepID=UPI003F5FE00C